jgi:hypothetical protein
MPNFADKQFIYEINTWVWLHELSTQFGQAITLANVPDEAVDAVVKPGIDYVWMMGVWQRSEYGRQIGLKWKHEYETALPDLTDDDVIGSAYAIGDYRVADAIGGREGLAAFHAQLQKHNIKLLLDYVPNHVATDHAWVTDHPDYIVQGKDGDLKARVSDFFAAQDKDGNAHVYAHGRDPFFPGWSDTAQLNVFNPDLRVATGNVLLDIASQCDGVRCDMAMLLMNDIFSATWKGYVGAAPEKDYWVEIISKVKTQFPDFIFIAEVYWNKEYDLLVQGFDFCYDKVFYDRMIASDVQKLRQHLIAELAYQQRLLRFIENHDEPRAYETLGSLRSYPAATLLCTLPGGTLLHDGQFVGRRVKLPVQIRRAPEERRHPQLEEHYTALLAETCSPVYLKGNFYLFTVNPPAANNVTYLNIIAYGWWNEQAGDYRLIVVNLTEFRSQGRVDLSPWAWLKNKRWSLYNVLDGEEFARHGGSMTKDGLYIDLDPYESFVFRFDDLEELAPAPAPMGGMHNEVF